MWGASLPVGLVRIVKSLPLLLTQPHACGYLDDKLARSVFVETSLLMHSSLYGFLMGHGFRRSGDAVYRPSCQSCSACVPVRLAVDRFKADRSQKRCWKKNAGTTARIKPAVFEQAHYDMYLRYQLARHAHGDMTKSTADEYMGFLASYWCKTLFVEFSIDQELAAVAVVDRAGNALSAVYTFFEPKFADFSLGTFAVLWQIRQAQLWRHEYVYLGFWIKDCQKMAYKSHYQPLQGFIDNQWVDLNFS